MTTATFNLSRAQHRASADVAARAAGTRPCPEHCAPGRVLSGRLRIERSIGMGSMGMVFEARHLELDTRVAVKAILPEMQAVPGMLALFAREAKAAAGIRSEHVAQVLDVGTDDALGPYIVMEYLEGQDLRALLDREGRIPAARAIDYILQACVALAVAHARGVIHRDIKPGNLFLTRQGELEIIKLLDFGVSKAALTGRLFGGELSEEEAVDLMGTPLYMSPEQVRAPERVDQRTDVWALGAVLYELVTGHSVFPGSDDLPTLLRGICDAAPPPLSEHGADLLPLQGVIDQCLDKNPARRFQNVSELAYALFPMAAARSQVHAHRAASILATPNSFVTPAPVAPLLGTPPELFASRPPGAAAGARAPRSRTPLPPRDERPCLRRPAIGKSRWVPHCVLLATLLLAWPGADEPVAQLGSETLRASGLSEASPSPPAAPATRAVLVESWPSGAQVTSDGQMIGMTPLSTLLPAGTVLLALTKPGYSEARELLQVELGKRGAAPLAVRVAMRALPAAPTSRSSAAARPPAARAAKPLVRPATSSPPGARQRRPASPPSGTSATQKPPAPPDRPRLRLVEDPASVHVASRL